MDRTLLEQECAEVFEEVFQDFPLTLILFHKLDRDKSVSIVKLCQELLTEFPIDKKCATFEFLARAIYSAQSMSVKTVNEYTSYLSDVHEVTETDDGGLRYFYHNWMNSYFTTVGKKIVENCICVLPNSMND